MAVENNGAASAARVEGHSAVFTALRKLLKPYEADLAIRIDKPGNCYLETRSSSLNGRRMFFAGAKIKKNYHLERSRATFGDESGDPPAERKTQDPSPSLGMTVCENCQRPTTNGQPTNDERPTTEVE